VHAFLAVAEELHFRRAADRLHITQPPLTRTIKALESELGTDLFERSTRSVSLTPAGEALVGPARQVLAALEAAAEAARAAARGDTGRVRVAFAGVSTHPLVAELARNVRADRTAVDLELSSQNFARSALRKLVEGDTDIALGRWDFVPEGVVSRVVDRDDLVLAVPAQDALATAREVSFSQVRDRRFVSLPPQEGSVLVDRLQRLAAAQRFEPLVAQLAPDTQTALALVSAAVGLHLTLASVSANVVDPHVAFVPVARGESAELPDVHLRVAWRENEAVPVVRSVLATLLNRR